MLLIIDNENGWLHQFHSMKFSEKAGGRLHSPPIIESLNR
jgi:hypothetical protein